VSTREGIKIPRPYIFVILLRDDSRATELIDLLRRLVFSGRDAEVAFARPQPPSVYIRSRDPLEDLIETLSYDGELVLLFQHTVELSQVLSRLRSNVRIYVSVPEITWIERYNRIPNVTAFLALDMVEFSVKIVADFSSFRDSRSNDPVLFDANAAVDQLTDGSTAQFRGLVRRMENRPSLLSELLEADLTLEELERVVSLEGVPNAPELIAPWFDSKRQVALALGAGSLGGVLAGLTGDATIIATTHGLLEQGIQASAVFSLTALTAGCGVAAAHFLNKVRNIAHRSLRVQTILSRRRQSS
jgi:hypothetical protein